MRREDIESFLKKKVNVVCIFGDSKDPFYYHGMLLSMNDDNLTILDKFGKLVVIEIEYIKKISEWVEDTSGG